MSQEPRGVSPTTMWRRKKRKADEPADAAASQEEQQPAVGATNPPAAATTNFPAGSRAATLSLVEAPRGRRGSKKLRVDLDVLGGAVDGGGSDEMFAEVVLAPADEYEGEALLCFLSADTFVGVFELEHEGQPHTIKLSGSESLTECDRAFCNVQDCCGDKAYAVTAQSSRGSRSFLARSSGIGDYVAFEGRGLHFETDFVPGDAERARLLARRFGALPRSARDDAVLCVGRMALNWRATDLGLPAEGEAAPVEGPPDAAAAPGLELGLQLPLDLVLPPGRNLTLRELVARGGTPLELGAVADVGW